MLTEGGSSVRAENIAGFNQGEVNALQKTDLRAAQALSGFLPKLTYSVKFSVAK